MELSEEQQVELAAALEGLNSDEAPAVETPAPEPVVAQEEESEPVQESEASQDEETPDADYGDEEEAETGHNVPYARFSKVIAAKNQFAEEAEALRDEVDRLRKAEGELETLRRYGMQQHQQAPAEESYEDDLSDPYDKRLQTLEARLGENEREAKIREHMSEMEQQIAVIQKEHPNVDPVALLQHVQHNPDADLMGLAVSEAARVAELRESVIADFLKENPGSHPQAAAVEAAPDVPPELKSKSNSGSRGFAGAKPPTTWEQAHTQAAQAIKAAWTG